MRKSTRIVKRLLALFLVVLMSIESFGALVSDNDGSAFITKGEFDSLKSSFQSQIDNYNTSIDSKIDGAISGYLAGIKLGKKMEMSLDRNCMYKFPMTCYIDDNRLWNDEHSDYYSVSIPSISGKNYITYVSKFNSNNSIQNEASYAAYDTGGPFTVPYKIPGDGVRVQWGTDNIDYTGIIGNLYHIKKSSLTRNIDGVSRTVWTLRTACTGQDNLQNFQSGIQSAWDGAPTSYKIFSDFEYIGYRVNPWGRFPGDSWGGPTTESQNLNTWNYTDGIGVWHQRDSAADYSKAESEHDERTIDNFADIKYWYNSEMTQTEWTTGGWQASLFGTPNVRILDTNESSCNKMIFAGTAYLPSYNENGYSYSPRALASAAADTKVVHQNIGFSARTKLYYYNYTSGSISIGAFNLKRHYVWPEWHATPYTNWQQETSDDFSMIRASVVSYEDSNGKTHYLDEGLYLGKYEDEGKVEFKIKFNGNNGISTRFALSKKPFGFNRNDNDRIKFKFTIDAEPTTPAIEVPAGGYGAINTNYTITIKVDDIEKNDELYMIWWPENSGDYVELDNITEYYLETTG